jgi:hypothetical protein
MPKNAVMIVKGDIITNSMRYLRVCENVRPDTTHLDQSMMTYPWFKPQQQRHFVNITFPNLHYHPYEKLGYSMQQVRLFTSIAHFARVQSSAVPRQELEAPQPAAFLFMRRLVPQ